MTNDVRGGDERTIESSERAKNRSDRARVRGIAILTMALGGAALIVGVLEFGANASMAAWEVLFAKEWGPLEIAAAAAMGLWGLAIYGLVFGPVRWAAYALGFATPAFIVFVALDPDTVATPISESLHLMTAFASGVLCVRAAAVTKRPAKRRDAVPQPSHLGEGALSTS